MLTYYLTLLHKESLFGVWTDLCWYIIYWYAVALSIIAGSSPTVETIYGALVLNGTDINAIVPFQDESGNADPVNITQEDDFIDLDLAIGFEADQTI